MTRYLDFSLRNDYLDNAMENYLINGFEPGGFLTSVLANDLRLAVGRADYWNKNNLATIVEHIIFNVPSGARGSYDAVRDWCADKDNRRSKYVKGKEQEMVMKILEGRHVNC